jgi:hypothetical protein
MCGNMHNIMYGNTEKYAAFIKVLFVEYFTTVWWMQEIYV